MYSITSSIAAGTPEECSYFPQFHFVDQVELAVDELQHGHDVMLPQGGDWAMQARQVLLRLGATVGWAEDVVSRAVEFRRIA